MLDLTKKVGVDDGVRQDICQQVLRRHSTPDLIGVNHRQELADYRREKCSPNEFVSFLVSCFRQAQVDPGCLT